MALLSPVLPLARLGRGFPSLDFSQLRKMMPALAINFMIAARNARRGRPKWNRHAVAPSDNLTLEMKCQTGAPSTQVQQNSEIQ